VIFNKCNQLDHGWRHFPNNTGATTKGNTAKVRMVQIDGVLSMANDTLKEQI
jgi:hypothetical protein